MRHGFRPRLRGLPALLGQRVKVGARHAVEASESTVRHGGGTGVEVGGSGSRVVQGLEMRDYDLGFRESIGTRG